MHDFVAVGEDQARAAYVAELRHRLGVADEDRRHVVVSGPVTLPREVAASLPGAERAYRLACSIDPRLDLEDQPDTRLVLESIASYALIHKSPPSAAEVLLLARAATEWIRRCDAEPADATPGTSERGLSWPSDDLVELPLEELGAVIHRNVATARKWTFTAEPEEVAGRAEESLWTQVVRARAAGDAESLGRVLREAYAVRTYRNTAASYNRRVRTRLPEPRPLEQLVDAVAVEAPYSEQNLLLARLSRLALDVLLSRAAGTRLSARRVAAFRSRLDPRVTHGELARALGIPESTLSDEIRAAHQACLLFIYLAYTLAPPTAAVSTRPEANRLLDQFDGLVSPKTPASDRRLLKCGGQSLAPDAALTIRADAEGFLVALGRRTDRRLLALRGDPDAAVDSLHTAEAGFARGVRGAHPRPRFWCVTGCSEHDPAQGEGR